MNTKERLFWLKNDDDMKIFISLVENRAHRWLQNKYFNRAIEIVVDYKLRNVKVGQIAAKHNLSAETVYKIMRHFAGRSVQLMEGARHE